MKKIIALLLLILLWYFAGMYLQPAVMAMAICCAILIPVLAVFAFVQKRRLTLTLPKTQLVVFKGIEKPVQIYAENKSPIPVNLFKVWLLLSYPHDKKPLKRKFTGSALGKNHREDNVSEFYLTAPYCGVITLSLKKMRVYDNLALFSSRKRLNEQTKILVYPVPVEMAIHIPAAGSYQNEPVTDTASDNRGDDHSEILMVREYRPGDLQRYVHQNYSARTDSLWVKEYKRENDAIIDLLFDTSSDIPINAETADAMYEILYSLIITLLHKEVLLKIHWYDSHRRGLVEYSLENTEQAAEMLAMLLNADTTCTKAVFAGAMQVLPPETMTVNSSLEWTFRDKTVYRFHKDVYRRELSSLSFSLVN